MDMFSKVLVFAFYDFTGEKEDPDIGQATTNVSHDH